MKSLLKPLLFFVFLLPIPQSHAFDKEKIDLLVEVMTVGCSIGMKVAIDVNAEGEISILKKGAEGKFAASKAEIPTVVDFLSDENLKGEQANKTRECMERYIPKIFAEITGNDEEPEEKNPPVAEHGVVYKLDGCYKQGRNKIQCELIVISSLVDRKILYFLWNGDSEHTALFDDSGSRYTPSSISVANHVNANKYSINDIPLIADVPMKMVVLFENIASNAKSISLLSIGALNYNPRKNYDVRFRDLKIEEKK